MELLDEKLDGCNALASSLKVIIIQYSEEEAGIKPLEEVTPIVSSTGNVFLNYEG